MQDLVVHTIPGSPFARAVLAGLKEKRLPHRLAAMSLADMKGERHLAMNPFGRIPVLQHGDFTLYETQAILRYLERIAPEPALIPANVMEEARMNQLAGISDWYVFPHISAGIAFHRLIAPKLGLPADENKVAASVDPARNCMQALDAFLDDKSFLAGETLTIADLMIGAHLDYFSLTGEGREMFAQRPRLAAWLERMQARPSFKETSWAVFERMLAA